MNWIFVERTSFPAILGQGGLERAVRNNDQPRVQHDVAAKNLAVDRSNAARSDHCSADR